MTTDNDRPEGRETPFLPLLDFSTLVLPFFTQGLVSLGLMDDPVRRSKAENLDLARRLIDLIQLLKERTEGNLLPDEAQFLESCLHQLRTVYLHKVQVLNP